MEDFPVLAKIIVWLIVGGTVAYAVGAFLYFNLLGS
jgi:hypothetical protein